MAQEVIVVGGGLSGMMAAYRLSQLGCAVTLYESDVRLGGKAGSIKVTDTYYADHGYHLFPGFYLTAWALMEELGILDNFVASGYMNYENGKFEQVVPPFLFLYSLIDLLVHSEKTVAPWTISGFVRSRWYCTDGVLEQYQDMVLKALSDPTFKISALTVQKMYGLWLRYIKIPLPTGTGGGIIGLIKSFVITGIARGSLQERWIFPIQNALEKNGVNIFMQRPLVKVDIDAQSQQLNSLTFQDAQTGNDLPPVDVRGKRVIFAIPQNNFLQLLPGVPFAQSTENFFKYEYLRTNQMMGIDIHLKTTLTNLPKAHVVLVGSKYESTLIDISQVWQTPDGKPQFDHSVIQCVSADTTELVTLSEKDIRDQLIDDILTFKLFTKDQVDYDRTVLQTNFTSPLFMNDVGTHPYRPTTRTPIKNAYTAGDWAMSIVDVASMENALLTGSLTADAVRQDLGISKAVPIPNYQPYPRWLLFIVLILMTPFAIVAKLWDMLMSLFK